MTDNIPAHAERFDIAVARHPHAEPSRYFSGLNVIVPKFMCRGCGTIREQPKQGETFQCKCGLHMQVKALDLYVWRKGRP